MKRALYLDDLRLPKDYYINKDLFTVETKTK